MHPWKHFKTITYHRLLVCKGCFSIGLYRQGLTHDLSKYSPVEFWNGARFYQGFQSPNNAERMAKGYSEAWQHHKGRNRHHFEYWIDFTCTGPDNEMVVKPVRMPDKYIAEMLIDRLSASKVYMGDKYTDDCSWKYYKHGDITSLLHPYTRTLLETWLLMLAKKGEKYTISWIRHFLKLPQKRRTEIVVKMAHGGISREDILG